MTHICDSCKRTFGSKVALELHRDSCSRDRLVCRRCGEQFDEASATRDGWHYECPGEDCEGSGLGSDLVRLEEARVGTDADVPELS